MSSSTSSSTDSTAGSRFDLSAALKGASRRSKTVRICLDGDRLTELWAAEDELEAYRPTQTADKRLVSPSDGERKQLEARVEVARQAVADAAHPFQLAALSQGAWQRLLLEHPPRIEGAPQDVEGDRMVGYNYDTFRPALVAATLIEPVVTPAEVEQLQEHLDPAQWADLTRAAFDVCQQQAAVPFTKAASRGTRSSASS